VAEEAVRDLPPGRVNTLFWVTGHSCQLLLRLCLWNNLPTAGYVIRTVSPVQPLRCCLIVRSFSVLVCLVVLIFIPKSMTLNI
jgi:hypothetical protein